VRHEAKAGIPRRGPWVAACLAALGCLAAATREPARAQGSGAREVAPADTFRVFEADLGPAWIDVNAYPPEQQQAYALFAQKCSKCHTLARPVNSSMRGDEWTAYVGRMSRKAGSGISPKDGEGILRFLIFDSQRRARAAGAVDPELIPFLRVSQELCGVRRFPASKQDIRAEDGLLRVAIAGDPRLDLSRFVVSDEGQRLVKWAARTANRGELALQAAAPATAPKPAPVAPAADEALRRAAAGAVGSATDPREKAERILDWLDEKVAREYRQGTATPAAVLADRRGDATEFTRLFVAMAGACGLPARSRVGLVARRTGFFLHAWAEVWLAGWTPVDPYLGQLPADLTHVRLVTPGDDAMAGWDARRVPGFDRLELRVVETAKPAKSGG
jgi:hypothetical protein